MQLLDLDIKHLDNSSIKVNNYQKPTAQYLLWMSQQAIPVVRTLDQPLHRTTRQHEEHITNALGKP